jgi:hypothetical protein
MNKKNNNRKFTFNDFILLLPLIGRIIFEVQYESKRTLRKRILIFFENTILYYVVGVISIVLYPDASILIIIIMFLGLSLFE